MIRNFIFSKLILNKSLREIAFKMQIVNSLNLQIPSTFRLLINRPVYQFCNDSVQFEVNSLRQLQKGYQYLKNHKYDLASLQLSLALNFLPKNQPNAKCIYKKQYGNLLKNLLICQLMCGKNISALKDRFEVVYKTKRFYQQLIFYQNADKSQKSYQHYLKMNSNSQNWRQILKLSFLLQKAQRQKISIQLAKVNQIKDVKCKLLFLYLLIKHEKQLPMQQIQKHILSLISIGKESDMLNISIYLFVAAQFFYKNQQYLMAEGLLNNICSQKQQNISHTFLKFDQQYIATKILLANVYKMVNRNNQAQNIIDQYAPIFNQRRFFMQQIVKIDYQSI